MLGLKKLDIYIMRKFLTTYVFSIALILGIAIIFDIQEKLEDFIEHQLPLRTIVVDYYCNFVPYFANLFSSLFVFISVIFITSKMASNTEIIAMHAAGVSFNRFLRPYMFSAAIIAAFSLYLILYVIPDSNKIRLDFEGRYVFNRTETYDKDIHKQISPDIYMFMESYTGAAQVGYRFSLEKFKDGRLVSKMISDYVKWDSVKQKWTVFSYYIRDIENGKETVSYGGQIDTTFLLTPKDFLIQNAEIDKMTISELNAYIAKLRLHGADNIDLYLVNKYQRFSWPFSTFILTLLGVCLSKRKKRGGIGASIGLGFLLSFTYILFMQVSTTFAINAGVSPLISVWIPNFIYGAIALVLYIKADK